MIYTYKQVLMIRIQGYPGFNFLFNRLNSFNAKYGIESFSLLFAKPEISYFIPFF